MKGEVLGWRASISSCLTARALWRG